MSATELVDQLGLDPSDSAELIKLAEVGVLRCGDDLLLNALSRRFDVPAGQFRSVCRQIGGSLERHHWESRYREVEPAGRFAREGSATDHAVDPHEAAASADPDVVGSDHPADELLR